MSESTKEPTKLVQKSLLQRLVATERLAMIKNYPIEIHRSPTNKCIIVITKSVKYHSINGLVTKLFKKKRRQQRTHVCRSPSQQQIRGKDVVILLSS